jgi:hypothetical protein
MIGEPLELLRKAFCGSMLTSLNEVGGDRRLAESLAGFQPMQAFDQNKPFAVGSHENRRLLQCWR